MSDLSPDPVIPPDSNNFQELQEYSVKTGTSYYGMLLFLFLMVLGTLASGFTIQRLKRRSISTHYSKLVKISR